MQTQRRTVLQQGTGLTVLSLAVAAGFIRPTTAHAKWNEKAFEARDMDSLIKALGGKAPTESKDVVLTGPDIAENGAVVPVTVKSNLPDTKRIAVLIQKNPNMLAAQFDITPELVPEVQTRVKMAETSDVFALVQAGDKYYFAKKEIKVTLGGCGG